MAKIKVGDYYTVKRGAFKGTRMKVTYRRGNLLHLKGNNIRLAYKI